MYLLALTLIMRFRHLGFKSFFFTSSAPCWFLMLLISHYGHAWIDGTSLGWGSLAMGGALLFYCRPSDRETYLRRYHSPFNQILLYFIPELALGAPFPHAVAMCILSGKNFTGLKHTLVSEGMIKENLGTEWPRLSAVLNAISPFAMLVTYFNILTFDCVCIALLLKGLLGGISALRQWVRVR
ncbi:BQ5605_C028g10579 [Microbotryum silenes-dioicae]|uniref:BQ5605_C028g10579 protein n=1 Tax=Microbotryum silenes-dioicae TaxID=796604 RepID=A0A2X0MM92_9BASI|nr:BQ5605_C028g10579 [Microbotryum silenes-dioicae]